MRFFRKTKAAKKQVTLKDVMVDTFFEIIELGNYERIGDHEDWERLYSEYIDSMGIDSGVKRLFDLKRTKLFYMKRVWVEGMKHMQANVDITQAEIDGLKVEMVKGRSFDLYSTMAALSKFMGMPINPTTTTMAQFIGYHKLMKDSMAKSKAA